MEKDLEQEKFNEEIKEKFKVDYPEFENKCDEVYKKCIECDEKRSNVKFFPMLCLFICLLIVSITGGTVLINNMSRKEKKVQITFVIGGKENIVETLKGSSINRDIIPLADKNETFELYYDEEMTNKYNYEPIEKNVRIYVVSDLYKDLPNFVLDDSCLVGIEYISIIESLYDSTSPIIFSNKEKIKEIFETFFIGTELTNDGEVIESFFKNSYNNNHYTITFKCDVSFSISIFNDGSILYSNENDDTYVSIKIKAVDLEQLKEKINEERR